jgi:formylglycine-generating enzyme required for sulfatase activity
MTLLVIAVLSPSHAISVEKKKPKSFTNSVGMKLVSIGAGEFRMGSPASEKTRDDDEAQHAVRLSRGFYMSTTEVTQGQFMKVMGTTPWKDKTFVKEDANQAASYISWEDATKYCVRLSKKEGRKYRLPSEAEWEYACRGGTTTVFSFGDDRKNLGSYGWYGGVIGDGSAKSEKYAHAVGQMRANAWGLYDMHGNVYEWCSDWYGKDYYGKSPVVDPVGPSSGSERVLRGGSWGIDAQYCRSAFRCGYTLTFRNDSVGFRVLCELD